MQIPESVKIGGHIYRVDMREAIFNSDNQRLYGECDFENTAIRIATTASHQRQCEALLHEITHAISDMFQIGLDESQVHQMGAALHMLIMDNPDMFRRNGE